MKIRVGVWAIIAFLGSSMILSMLEGELEMALAVLAVFAAIAKDLLKASNGVTD